jgi:hypothetical protein
MELLKNYRGKKIFSVAVVDTRTPYHSVRISATVVLLAATNGATMCVCVCV